VTELPETVDAGDIAFVRADSPADFAHWTSSAPGRAVSIIVEPADVPNDETLAIAGDVAAQFDDVIETALEFVREQLRDAEPALSAGDLALLDDDGSFADPEAVIWGDGTWMLRFADCGLDIASEYGIGVNFVGAAPQAIDLFDDAEVVDDH
jgi:hypothetical protein